MATEVRERSGRPPEEQLGRRERKKLEVYRRIRRAAVELFHEKGYEATTVEEIAERADVAKGTFFNYFPRKDALLAALAEEMLEQLFTDLGPLESWSGSGRDQLLRFFLKVADFVERDPELSKVMLIENMRNFWRNAAEEPVEQEFRRITRTVIARARSRGEIGSQADIEIAAQLLEAAYVTTMVEWLRDGAPAQAFREEFTIKLDIIFRGLGACDPAGEGEEG